MDQQLTTDATHLFTTEDHASRMISLVSHKLKTPLSIINGYSEAILGQMEQEHFSAFTTKALIEINQQGTKLSNLVYKLLFFNKVEMMTERDLTKKPVNLKRLIGMCTERVLLGLEENNPAKEAADPQEKTSPILIETDCSSTLEVKADEKLLVYLLRELLANAIKFNNKQEKVIKIQCVHHGGNVSLSVRDYGVGIRPQDVNRIFDRFYQVDDDFTGQVDGWGLGLPTVKKILQLHGGSISVISDRGLGSIFTVSLPLA